MDVAQIGLRADSSQIRRANQDLGRFRQGARTTETATERMNRQNRRLTESFRTLGGVAAGALATIGAARIAQSVIQSTADFERQLVEINKTTDISGENLQNLGLNIQEIGQDIPVATNRLLSFATAAGQLGVRGTENIEAFVTTLGQLELATDIAGEEGARSLARILNVTGEATENIDRLGSSLVGLGNNFAATESEIVRTSQFVAASTTQFELSTQEVLGLSAGLQALGQRAETSGSSVGAALGEINNAIQNGGENLDTLIELTGKSAQELEREFAGNATGVLLDFTEALQGVSDQQFPEILDEFSLAGRETQRVINALVSGNDQLRRAVKQAGVEWENNTAAQEEADKAADSLSADMQRLSNTVTELMTQEEGLPEFREAVQSLNDTLQDPNVQAAFDGFASWLATVANVGANAAGSVAQAMENVGNLAGVLTEGSFGAGRVLEDMEQLNTQIDLLTDRAFGLRNQIEALESRETLSGREQNRLESLRQQYNANRDAISDLRDRQAELNAESEMFIPTIEVTAEAANDSTFSLQELNAQIAFLDSSGASASDSLTGLQAAFGGSAEEARALNEEARKLIGLQSEFDAMFEGFLRDRAESDVTSISGAFGDLGGDSVGGDDQTEAMRDASRMMDRIDRQMEEMNGNGRELGRTFQSAFEDAVVEGENLRGVLQGLLDDIVRIMVRKNVSEPLGDAVSGFDWGSLIGSAVGGSSGGSMGAGTGSSPAMATSADGNVFTSPSITSISERGHAEAVLPLERQGGKLGVNASGGGERGGDTYIVDARGADQARIAQLEARLTAMGATVERRAVAAVNNQRQRSFRG